MKHRARRMIPAALAALLLSGGFASAAEAGWHGGHGHGWDRGYHHHHRSTGSISFGFYSPPEPVYIEPQPVYYTPAPAYTPPVTGYAPSYSEPDRYCREYNTTSRVAGRMQNTYGTACMQPDGSWQIVD